jgi:hypothetical protein
MTPTRAFALYPRCRDGVDLPPTNGSTIRVGRQALLCHYNPVITVRRGATWRGPKTAQTAGR